MNTEDANMQIIITVLKPLLGKQLMKQVICVILLIFDVDEKKIMERLNVSYNTIKKYANLLRNKKLSELFEDKAYRPKSEMDDYRSEIMDELDRKTSSNIERNSSHN